MIKSCIAFQQLQPGDYQDVWFINDYTYDDVATGITDTSGSFSSDDHITGGSNYTQNNRQMV